MVLTWTLCTIECLWHKYLPPLFCVSVHTAARVRLITHFITNDWKDLWQKTALEIFNTKKGNFKYRMFAFVEFLLHTAILIVMVRGWFWRGINKIKLRWGRSFSGESILGFKKCPLNQNGLKRSEPHKKVCNLL